MESKIKSLCLNRRGLRNPSPLFIAQFHSIAAILPLVFDRGWRRWRRKTKSQLRNINSELPSAILEVIFSKLPFFNLPSCRLVCKEWNDLILACKFDPQISISSLFFDHTHPSDDNLHCMALDTKHLKGVRSVASFNFHPKLASECKYFSIINSCNGLFCILTNMCRSVCILNPMTNEYLNFPISKDEYSSRNYHYGLGFSPKTKQYKLVRSSTILHDVYGTLIEIFAFGKTHEWISVCFLPSFFSWNDFVYFNGGLYLVKGYRNRVIYRLDVDDETIKEISYPIDKGWFNQMVELNGTLYLTIHLNDHLFLVWKMREDFSWIKAFVFLASTNNSICFNLLKAYENGKILCEYRDFELDLIFYLYDPVSETKEILANEDLEIWSIKSFHQIRSPNFNSLHKILVGKD